MQPLLSLQTVLNCEVFLTISPQRRNTFKGKGKPYLCTALYYELLISKALRCWFFLTIRKLFGCCRSLIQNCTWRPLFLVRWFGKLSPDVKQAYLPSLSRTCTAVSDHPALVQAQLPLTSLANGRTWTTLCRTTPETCRSGVCTQVFAVSLRVGVYAHSCSRHLLLSRTEQPAPREVIRDRSNSFAISEPWHFSWIGRLPRKTRPWVTFRAWSRWRFATLNAFSFICEGFSGFCQ